MSVQVCILGIAAMSGVSNCSRIVAACRAGMILFYVIDAAAIYAVLKQHPHDSDKAVCLHYCLP